MMKPSPARPRPRGSIVAGLDIGSSKVACLIGRVTDDQGGVEIVGVGHRASRGVRAGVIVDIVEAEAAIRQTVHAAEQMAADHLGGYPLREVIVAVPATVTQSLLMQVDVQIYGHEVTDNDVGRALAKAQDFVLSESRELVHTIPTHYRIDGQDGIRDPRGLYGQSLEAGTHIVAGDVSALRNLAACTERSFLDINAFCVAPYAAALSSLVDDEMELGCLVIDCGGGVTSYAVFHGNALLFCGAVPIGGHHVTNDIARGLTTSLDHAERLKTLHGSAMVAGTDDREMIDVIPLGEEDTEPSHTVPRSLLTGIIRPRIDEIFEMIRTELQDNGLAAIAGRRAILTGGGAQLNGLRDVAQTYLDRQVRLGRPLRLRGLPDAASGPAFSTAAGLLVYGVTRAQDMPAFIARFGEERGPVGRFFHWFKKNW